MLTVETKTVKRASASTRFQFRREYTLQICIGYRMSVEVISVLSLELEERCYNCHERARDNYDIVMLAHLAGFK